MKIKAVVIEGEQGDVVITSRFRGAAVTCNHEILAEIEYDEDAESRRRKAFIVAGAVYGKHKGQPNATGSMIYDVRCRMEELAGC